MNCGFITSASLTQLRDTCVTVLPGTSPLDAGCSSSFECQPLVGYCTNSDGGVCAPLAGADGGCTTQDMCSYGALGGAGPMGNPSLYCDTTTTHTCVPREQDDAGCTQNYQCGFNACLYPPVGNTGSCQSSGVFSDPGVAGGTCDYFTIKDAGSE